MSGIISGNQSLNCVRNSSGVSVRRLPFLLLIFFASCMSDSSRNITSFSDSFLSKNRRKIAEVGVTDSIGRFFLVDAFIRRYEASCSYFRADRPSWRENRQRHPFGVVGRSPANRALIWSFIIESISGQQPLRRPFCGNAL